MQQTTTREEHHMPSETLTADSLELFLGLAEDADNWSGNPLITLTAAQRGNLTDLKKRGLLSTFDDGGCDFAIFKPAGIALAAEHGIDLTWI